LVDWSKLSLLGGGFSSRSPDERWCTDDNGERENLWLHRAATSAEGVVWVKPPMKQHWFCKDKVETWGNKSVKAAWYVAAALIVEVPKYGTGVRAAV
jgi:hypothetical protein